jgi:hypothetical protein
MQLFKHGSLVWSLLLLALNAGRADASLILASSYNTPSGSGFEGGGPNATKLVQQFTLSTLDTITSIDGAMGYSIGGGFPASDLTLTIVNDSSNRPGSTVLATDTAVTGTLVNYLTAFDDINFTFASPSLGPGTYWLVLSVASLFDLSDWEYQTPGTVDASGPGGKINPLSGWGSNYNAVAYLTTINGTVGSSATPEPATVVTALCAVAAMWAIRRRRRQIV